MNGKTTTPATDERSIEALMETCELAVRRAGTLLREHWDEFLASGLGFKGPVNLVTEGDRRAEEQILSALRSRYPDDAVLTEERGSLGGRTPYRWLIDPLDGTTNYAHGLPVFAVSVAVEREGRVLAGAVYEPVAERLYVAGRGRGARRNGRRLQVSEVGELDRCLLATGFAYNLREAGEQTNLDHFANFSRRVQGIRRLGAAALDLCWVAEGWFDGFWEYRLHPWDVAAGMLIVEEAGGKVTDFRGQPLTLASETVNIVASNGRVHDAMLAVLKLGRTGMEG